AFSPDGRRLAVATPFDLTVWDLASGQAVAVRNWTGGRQMLYSPDGSTIALLTSSHVNLIDAATAEDRQIVRPDRALFVALAVSPDGRTLATAAGNVAQFWDTADGRPLRTWD